MDYRVKNKNAEISKRIFIIVTGLYLVIIQLILIFTSGNISQLILNLLFEENNQIVLYLSETSIDSLINVILSGTGYLVIYFIVRFIYGHYWIYKNRSCYLSGKWYHIHTKEGDDQYIRCGVVEINQNYYNIAVHASNFEPKSITESGRIETNNKNITYWDYTMSDLLETGGFIAEYTANKVSGPTRINRGIHQLRVIDYDARGYPSVLGGIFADIAPSTSEGNIRLYRNYPVSNIMRLYYSLHYKLTDLKKEVHNMSNEKRNNDTASNYTNTESSLYPNPDKWRKDLKILLDERTKRNMKLIETPMSEDKLVNKIIAIVKEAGKKLNNVVEDKIMSFEKTSYRDIYTTYDVTIQNYLTEKLSQILPDAVFVGEEGEWENKDLVMNGYAFVIDPIDGTSNFVHNHKHSCISVGLLHDGIAEIGVIYNPYLDEVFYASKGDGSFLNGHRIKCSNTTLKESLIGFGTAPYNLELSHDTFAFTEHIFHHSNDLRRTGSSALDLCYVASGRLDAFYEFSLYPWDYAAGGLIVKEADGVISDLDGNDLVYNKKCSVIAGGKITHEEFIEQYYQYKLNTQHNSI